MMKLLRNVCIFLVALSCVPNAAISDQSEDAGRRLQGMVDELLGRGQADVGDDIGYTGLISCVFTKIEVEKKDRWFEATAPAFSIYPCETVDVRVRKRFGDGKETIHITWDSEDDELKFCKRPSSGSCNDIRVDGRRFATGMQINFMINEEARGVASCRYAR